MKAIGLILLAVSVAGCSASRFSSDPRAAVVGPAFLDTIAEHPRDRDTQFYYPSFTLHGSENWVDPSANLPRSAVSPQVAALLIDISEPPQAVKEIAGKGYPDLERSGMRLFTAKRD